MADLTPSQHALLRTDFWFASLPHALADWLVVHGLLRRLRPGQHLFFRGDAPDGIYAVLEGSLRVYGGTADGREALLSLLEPPVWLGEIALFDGLPRTHDVQADGDVCVLHVPQADLLALLREHPAWWQAIGVLMSWKVRLLFINQENQTLLPPEGLLARRLFWMLRSSPLDLARDRLQLKVKQVTLAQMLCMSRQTANRLLMTLQQRGIVRLSYGTIEVLDAMALADAAELTPIERKMLQILDSRARDIP